MMTQSRSKMIAVGLVAAIAGGGIGIAAASQPQMDASLRALHAAQDNLGHVSMDKGGHAANARRLVADAISQVEQGIEYGRAHGY